MKTATILPTHYLGLIDDKDYHMALAHLIGKDKVYTEFYKNQAACGAFVILDNSLIENAKQDITAICKKADLIGAKEIILPDVFRNKDETLFESYEALDYVKTKYPHLRVMVVPQGDTMEEWFECADDMLTWPIDTLGIPKVLVAIGGRDGRLEALQKLGHKVRGLDVHLLGCWETPLELTLIAKAEEQGLILPVRGVDSAIAYVYARDNILISHAPRPSGAVDFSAHDADLECLQRNLDIWEGSVYVKQGKVAQIF